MSLIRNTVLVTLIAGCCAWAQDRAERTYSDDAPVKVNTKQQSPGRQVAGGAGNIGTGAAKGAGHLAKGAGNGAVDLLTLHPIDAGVAMGRGAVNAGKDVTVGTVKGTARMTKGVGRAIKHIF